MKSKGAGLSTHLRINLRFYMLQRKRMRENRDLHVSRPTESLIGKTWNPKNEKRTKITSKNKKSTWHLWGC